MSDFDRGALIGLSKPTLIDVIERKHKRIEKLEKERARLKKVIRKYAPEIALAPNQEGREG